LIPEYFDITFFLFKKLRSTEKLKSFRFSDKIITRRLRLEIQSKSLTHIYRKYSLKPFSVQDTEKT